MHYLITFTTYGTWLPGDERGSHSRRLGPVIPTAWYAAELPKR